MQCNPELTDIQLISLHATIFFFSFNSLEIPTQYLKAMVNNLEEIPTVI